MTFIEPNKSISGRWYHEMAICAHDIEAIGKNPLINPNIQIGAVRYYFIMSNPFIINNVIFVTNV